MPDGQSAPADDVKRANHSIVKKVHLLNKLHWKIYMLLSVCLHHLKCWIKQYSAHNVRVCVVCWLNLYEIYISYILYIICGNIMFIN